MQTFEKQTYQIMWKNVCHICGVVYINHASNGPAPLIKSRDFNIYLHPKPICQLAILSKSVEIILSFYH
uniref:Uncharacterized protein n=1 Tax=Pararge aegeria TaxID=116150 RepID=S4PG84_9NEOP